MAKKWDNNVSLIYFKFVGEFMSASCLVGDLLIPVYQIIAHGRAIINDRIHNGGKRNLQYT